MNYQELITKLEQKENFKFLRFGDGEFISYFDEDKAPCPNEQDKNDKLKEETKYIIDHLKPEHYNGLQNLSVRIWGERIPKRDWCDSDILHRASIRGELNLFFRVLKDREVVMISNIHTKRIKTLINYKYYIQVRDRNCYLDRDIVLAEVNKKEYPKDTVFLFASSRMTVPVIYNSERTDVTMIDCGSLFEPYIGNNSRSYHKMINGDILTKNTTI